MSIQPELIKQSQLLGKLVLDRQSMEEMGKVDRVWLDHHTHRIVGITCKAGLLGMKKISFAWQQIYSLGNNILVNTIAESDTWQKPDNLEQILDWELLTEDGNKAGKIDDYLIEPTTGEVISYLFLASDRGNILTRRFLLTPEGITNIGNKRVLARTIAVETSEPYTEGLNRLLVQAREFIIEDKNKTIQHVDAVKQRFTDAIYQFKEEAPPKLEQVKGQVTDKVQELKGQATEKAQELKVQATEKVQGFREQAQGFREQATEKAQELKVQATEKAQVLAEQATEKAQEIRGQATEKAQGFKEQAQGFREQATEKAQELAEQAKGKAQSFADGAQPIINQAIDQAKEKAQSLAEGAQPMINQAKEKVQAIAEEAKKQLTDHPPELAAPEDKITQTIDTTAERVVITLPAGETAPVATPEVPTPHKSTVESHD